MEIVKTADVPALISNIELRDIVSKNLEKSRLKREDEQRKLDEAAEKNTNRRNSRNRRKIKLTATDWIEQQVHDYIETTPCVNLVQDKTQIRNFVRRLRMPKKKEEELHNFGLTDAETLQILNLVPTELVELHLIVEDISSRLDDDRQAELLEFIKKFNINASESAYESVEPSTFREDVVDEETEEEFNPTIKDEEEEMMAENNEEQDEEMEEVIEEMDEEYAVGYNQGFVKGEMEEEEEVIEENDDDYVHEEENEKGKTKNGSTEKTAKIGNGFNRNSNGNHALEKDYAKNKQIRVKSEPF